MSKKQSSSNGIVYSTDPDFQLGPDGTQVKETLMPAKQPLKIRLDTKQRGGKAVTLVEGFAGKQDDLEKLGKQVKTYCGTGGAVKDWQIMIQGDQREKVLSWLKKNGYALAKLI